MEGVPQLARQYMASGEVAGIGALLKPNKYSILKFVDLHPGGAAALSGQVILPYRLFSSE